MPEDYILTIGLEVHAQLSTETKIFCADSTMFGQKPNTQVSPISLGHPGTLPVTNKRAVELAIKMGIACGSDINRCTYFDRKSYFYPDLPKGYQTTQDHEPICRGGMVEIKLPNGDFRHISLNRIHLEEDAGKLMHSEEIPFSQIDLNRAGIPLIEIVTEPVLTSAEEAGAFLTEVRKLVRYLQICDGNMEEGSLRCDANVSIRPLHSDSLGKKVEIKNMNSIRYVQKAIDAEYARQTGLLNRGEAVVSETRMFDVQSGKTFGLRQKEELNDYRYFPCPDLPPIVVDHVWLESIVAEMPELPGVVKKRLLQDYQISESAAVFLTESRELIACFESVCSLAPFPRSVANWLMGPVRAYFNEAGLEMEAMKIEPARIASLVKLVEDGRVSFSVAAQSVLPKLLAGQQMDAYEIALDLNLIQNSDTASLEAMAQEVLRQMPEKVKEYKAGKKGLIGLFVGEVKKASGGKADPKLTNEILLRLLS